MEPRGLAGKRPRGRGGRLEVVIARVGHNLQTHSRHVGDAPAGTKVGGAFDGAAGALAFHASLNVALSCGHVSDMSWTCHGHVFHASLDVAATRATK